MEKSSNVGKSLCTIKSVGIKNNCKKSTKLARIQTLTYILVLIISGNLLVVIPTIC